MKLKGVPAWKTARKETTMPLVQDISFGETQTMKRSPRQRLWLSDKGQGLYYSTL